MPRELEYTEHAKHSQGNEGARHVLVVRDAESDVVGQYGDHVDYRHNGAHEAAAIRSREQPQPVLDGEDHNARRVQAEERDVVTHAARLHLVGAWYPAARYRLEYVGAHLAGAWLR